MTVLLFCNFCGKNGNEVALLVSGPKVYICNECVGLCVFILEEKGVGVSFPSDPTNVPRGILSPSIPSLTDLSEIVEQKLQPVMEALVLIAEKISEKPLPKPKNPSHLKGRKNPRSRRYKESQFENDERLRKHDLEILAAGVTLNKLNREVRHKARQAAGFPDDEVPDLDPEEARKRMIERLLAGNPSRQK